MTRETDGRRIEFGPAFSILFVPLLCVGAVLSIPYCWVLGAVERRRERRLRDDMAAAGRRMTWATFAEKLERANGTLLCDYTISGWPSGYYRLWWTPENVYLTCPYRWMQGGVDAEDEELRHAIDWCRKRYTCAGGKALLIDCSRAEARSLFAHGRPLHAMNWADLVVGPPASAIRETNASLEIDHKTNR